MRGKHFIVYSHGFGVKKDDRGLFTDIAARLPNIEHGMFNYNEIDEANNTLVACPLDTQAQKLNEVLAKIHDNNVDAIIDIVAHSQGCVASAIAQPQRANKIIFLAPPAQFLGLEKREIYKTRPDTITEDDGTLRMPRRDGSMTIIRDDYWRSREGIRPIELYNQLSRLVDLTIITATEDEVLTDTNFSGLSPDINVIKQPANHDFTDKHREPLLKVISKLVG